MRDAKKIIATALDAADANDMDCVPGTDIPKNSIGASDFDKPMTDEEREKAIETEMPHCAPAVKAWVRQNKSPVSEMWLLEDSAKKRQINWEDLDERDPWNCKNPLFGFETFWENAPRDASADSRYAEFVGDHTEQEIDAGRKVEDIILSDLGMLDQFPVQERAKNIAQGKKI